MNASEKVSRVLYRRDYGSWQHYLFKCPACECMHSVDVGDVPNGDPRWTFDGNLEAPTFFPSVKYLRSGCHFFVRAGVIEFCSDAPNMANQKVPMLDAD